MVVLIGNVLFAVTTMFLPLVLISWIFLRERMRRWDGLRNKSSYRLLVVLGSGGHTTEALNLVGALPDRLFPNRMYIYAESDAISHGKLTDAESRWGKFGTYECHVIPRSREVRQSYLSSVRTTLASFAASIPIVWRLCPDVVLCTGPGTCLPVCLVAWLMRIGGRKNVAIVFVESFCRVKSLSLCGKLVYHFGCVDKVVVQWPELKTKYPRTEYLGGRVN